MVDALGMLGLARRAGAVVPGAGATRRSIRDGVARLVVTAADAAQQQVDRVERAAGQLGVPTISVSNRVTLGAAVGRGPTTALAVTDRRFADRLRLGLRDNSDESAQTGAAGFMTSAGGDP